MANVKITDLIELAATPDNADLLEIVDMAPTPTSKKITAANLRAGLAASGANSDITSMTGLDDDGIPVAKVADAMKDDGSNLAIGSDADGDTYYRASGALARLAKGTANFKMFMNAAGTAPEWAAGLSVVATTRDTSLTADWAVTGAGFKPSAIIVWGGIQNVHLSWGCFSSSVNINLADYGSTRYIDQACCFSAWEDAYKYQQYAVKSWDADGVTFACTKTGSPTATAIAVIFFIR